MLLAIILTTALSAAYAVPDNIQVSGITGTYSDANGLYTKQTVISALGYGNTNSYNYLNSYDRYYWKRTSGANTYYIYLKQWTTTSSYYWIIDNDFDDQASVLFYNSISGGAGYNVANSIIIPQSPDLVEGWLGADQSGAGAVANGSATVSIPPIAPTVTTQAASNIAVNTATGNGNITALGSPNPTAYGICWSTTGTPTTANNKVDIGATSSTGAFTASMTGLTGNTIYYVRAYATNTSGTNYGDVQTFTTLLPPPGNALDFGGTNEFVSLPINSDFGFPGNSTFTFEAWIYYTGGGSALFTKGGVFGNTEYAFLIDPATNKLIFLVGKQSIAWQSVVTSVSIVPTNSWTHIAVVKNGANATLNLNGIDDATGTLNATSLSATNGSSYSIILGGNGWGNDFNGKMDEVRFWNTARSQSELQNSMNGVFDHNSSNLRLYYTFDQGNAGADNKALPNEVIDYSGNCNKGTLSGFTLTGNTSNWVSTGNPEAPVLTTTAASSIAANNAVLNGNIFSIGETDVTTRGFCYSTSNCPTLANSVVNQTGTYAAGTYNLAITGLTAVTTYYCRAYATNSKGTSYGEEMTFTTPTATAIDQPIDGSMVLYPNPTTDGFTIDAGATATELTIVDLSGRTVLTQAVTGKTYVDVSSLSKGVYVVKLNGKNSKLVKR